MISRVLPLLCVLLALTGCGDYAWPFMGHPGATATRLAQPTTPLLVVTPPDAALLPDAAAARALAENLAVALQLEDVPAVPRAGRAGEWRLVTRLEARAGTIVPVFIVLDPSGADKGNTEGAPMPVTDWAAPNPKLLHQVAAEAASRVSALLTGIRIARDRADPHSLLNRPPKVMLAEVTGAPGDGNKSLTRQAGVHLAAYGVVVQNTRQGADFLVRAEVSVTPVAGGKERVEIVWTVTVPSGDERGKVAQLNEIPAGTLAGYWGDVADVVATEAAGGLYDVLIRQTGRETVGRVEPTPAPEEALPVPPPAPASKKRKRAER